MQRKEEKIEWERLEISLRKLEIPRELSCKKVREFQKNIYFCFIDYVKAFDCVDHNQLENY